MTTLFSSRRLLCLLLLWPTIVFSFSVFRQSSFCSKRSRLVVSLTPSSSNWYNDPMVAWSLRLGTGLFTYASLVALLDRPRGTLLAPESLLEVRPSAVAGLGLFVTQDLRAGTVLGTYPGLVISLNDPRVQQKANQYPECQTYIWRFSDNSALIDPTNGVGTLDDFCRSPTAPFLFRVATTLCRINEPPKGKDVNVVTDEVLNERIVVLRLERDVVAGEELFMDYGPQYDRSAYR